MRRIAGRCRLNVPAASGRIVLHVPDGRRPTPNDPRILSFRAFFLGWAGTALSPPLAVLAAHDIAASEVGVRFGSGWYDVEQGRDGPFRWAGQDARLFVRPPDGPVRPLTLLVEPGPGVAYRSFILEVRDDTGRCVRRQRVDGWRPLVLHLPVESGRERCWTLHVRGGHQLAEADGRLLNFRVFAPVRWGRQRWPTVRHLLQPLRALQSRSTLATVRTAAHFACPEPLHLGTAGDFTLMARAHWFAVRGYPQFAVFPLHVDTLLCYQAHHSGARETILQDPLRLYHIEHGFGTAWIGPGVSPIVQRLAAEGIPSLGAGQVLRWATEMRRRGRPLLFNAADWGLADLDLPES
ncbi:MAG: hypothetical protein JNM56_35460 [Planctomycetia bacterium]|nr:hypothetical protein [Planctomycetia bacterium]